MARNEIEALRETVQLMDNHSQNAFSGIKAVCSLALQAMEQRSQAVSMEDLAQALSVILMLAEDGEGCINVEAEQVGAHYKDEALFRRMDARRAWNELRSKRVDAAQPVGGEQ